MTAAATLIAAVTLYAFRKDVHGIYRSILYDGKSCRSLALLDKVSLAISRVEEQIILLEKSLSGVDPAQKEKASSQVIKLMIELKVDIDYIYDKLDATQGNVQVRDTRKLLVDRLKKSDETLEGWMRLYKL